MPEFKTDEYWEIQMAIAVADDRERQLLARQGQLRASHTATGQVAK
ncbi:hypothetical protein [Antarcticimicrobium sediminis]|nr:hypothetical protein [Antarcticimicrobium sediminis]